MPTLNRYHSEYNLLLRYRADVRPAVDEKHLTDDELPAAADEDTYDSGWEPAPAKSHVAKFRIVYHGYSPHSSTTPSQLFVTFKAKGRHPARTYRYQSRDHRMLFDTFHELTEVVHPGIVVWEWLIRPHVPVFRVS